jgi:xanthine dehydrogenase YagS FAD-binding subunit
MSVIRDVMPAFELFQPASVADALSLLDRHGATAWVLAGGLDTFDWLKDRVNRWAHKS